MARDSSVDVSAGRAALENGNLVVGMDIAEDHAGDQVGFQENPRDTPSALRDVSRVSLVVIEDKNLILMSTQRGRQVRQGGHR